jgi:HlyD family secretion protein
MRMRRLLWVALGVTALLVAAYFVMGNPLMKKTEIPTARARKGEFLITLAATGEVQAKRAYTIVAPRIHNIQITWMAPEGSVVKAGDPVIRFDSTQQQADLAENQSGLQISQTALERQNEELTIQEKQLALELRRAQRTYDEQKHEAPKVAEEARLALEVAELNARAKLDQIRADIRKSELEVTRAKDKVNLAQKELEQMTLTAPLPGMAVYLEIWKGNTMGKVQEGDSPWPGQGLINIPDLSEMIVEATVSEVDASRVQPDQEAIITLDAFPDSHFKGKVVRKGTLARRKEQGSKINVFDVEIAILDHDERLKPGMSASSKIVIDRLENTVTIPLEAVFEVGDTTCVYLANRKARPVRVGRRNDMEIEIPAGLEGDETVCLIDPRFAKRGLPGDKATEPELNKGRTAGPAGPVPHRGERRTEKRSAR